MQNPCLDAVAEVLNQHGIAFTSRRGGKHTRIDGVINGRRFRLNVPTTTGDRRAPLNCASDARRLIRDHRPAEAPQEAAMADTRQPVTVQEIDFHGSKLGTFEADGQKWVVMRPVVEGMGIAWTGQHAKITGKGHPWGVKNFLTPTAGGDQEMVCLPLRTYPFWLATMNPLKVPAGPAREKVILYKDASVEALYQFWTRGEATVDSVAEALGRQQQERQQSPGDDDLSAMLGLMQEQFDRLAAAVADRRGLSEEDMKRLLRQHCEWEQRQHGRLRDEVHAGAGRVIKTLRNEPASASLGDDVDLDAGYRACGIEGPIPARRKLSARVTNMVDAYCRKHRIPVGQIVVRGVEVKVWPRTAFRDWYGEEGSAFIGEHIRRATAGGHQARPGEPNVVDLFSPQPGAR